MSETSYRAAWVPDDDPARPWGDAAAPIVDWIADCAADLGLRPVLVTNAKGSHDAMPEFRPFTWGRTWFSRHAGGRPARNTPTVSYVPDAEDFEFARQLAGDSAIGVVESKSFRLGGWAAEVGATNLWTGEVTPPLPEDAHRALLKLAFYGNNGYTEQYGKRSAVGGLSALLDHMDGDLIPGALAAHGISARGQKVIAGMLRE